MPRPEEIITGDLPLSVHPTDLSLLIPPQRSPVSVISSAASVPEGGRPGLAVVRRRQRLRVGVQRWRRDASVATQPAAPVAAWSAVPGAGTRSMPVSAAAQVS